jgi:Ca-activated chloride channel homolog
LRRFRPQFLIVTSLALLSIGAFQSSASVTARSTPPEQFALTVTITNKHGEFVPDLKKEDFVVTVDDMPAELVDLAQGNFPMSIGFLIDTSGSVADEKLMRAFVQGLKVFMDASNPSNDYFLLGFNNESQLLMNWTTDHSVIVNSVRNIRVGSSTAVNDACYLAIWKTQQGQHPKRVLILVSDGLDTNSRYSYEQVKAALRESDVLFYTIHLTANLEPGIIVAYDGEELLSTLATISGGVFFRNKPGGKLLDSSDAPKVFESIANELTHQYSMVIRPEVSPRKDRWHKLKVRVDGGPDAPSSLKGLSVRTRGGLYFRQTTQ